MSVLKYIEPMACGICHRPRPHGRQWDRRAGVHQWTMPTQEQIKQRMTHRREYHGGIRWR